MQYTDLGGVWHMTGGGFSVDGQVPGSVYSFLLEAGKIPDPYYRDNECRVLPLMEEDYTFTRTFRYTRQAGRLCLHCDGLDTVCDVYVNGTAIAHTENMHRTYEWDISGVVRDGENELRLVFTSPLREARHRYEQVPLLPSNEVVRGFQNLRKAYCMFGWDWGPMLPDAGIWRAIYLVQEDTPRITAVRIEQRHDQNRVFLTVTAEATVPCELTAVLTAPDGTTLPLAVGQETEVPSPQLWWPNGLGEQPLYTVTVEAEGGDRQSRRIGLRTMKLIRRRDRYGESFYHEVNGIGVFAMGADYVPQDNLLSRITPERTRTLLRHAHDCHFNAIRVWGGGIYPDEAFFDACDEFGLLVFEDFMVACRVLPDEPALRDEVEAEVRDNLCRIRHHACLAVLSGNNEVEQMVFDCSATEELKQGYCELFEERLPRVIEEVCPELPYIPSSPTTCGHFVDPFNEDFGDTHYWNVWHKDVPFIEYRRHYFRYLSEFGFQSFPCEKTVNTFALPEDKNVFSRIMERHQRSGPANGKIIYYLSQTFLYPQEFGMLLYASQLLQAMAMRTAVEHLRRHRGRCMGALYWQFNDIWPGASWASIDSCGRYKALQYAAKRFFAPVLLSCEEVGETANRSAVYLQEEYFPYVTTASFAVTNDTREAFNGTVCWELCTPDSTVLCRGEQAVSVPPLSAVTLETLDFNKTDVQQNHLAYTLARDGETVSFGTALFTAPKHYAFCDPHLTAERHGDYITVTAQAYAASVWIDSPDDDIVLEDNAFDMEAGTRTVRLLAGDPKSLTVHSVYDIR